ncbi:MAG: radical SAM family heme chaperone HemW [Phycisphaerales bacterium]|nr:radical SAM family heme chaperone HemW [Phycisphaerales bacterium]
MPLGLYVHVPFCETKCGYCDFYSVPLGDRATTPVVDATLRELADRTKAIPEPIRTIFVGGGTPTLLPPDDLQRLLSALGSVARQHAVEEFTVEANPATVDEPKARQLVDSGVTRVSMGAQSFFPVELAALERLHSPQDIPPSVETLRRCGVRQINLDLIFGIPGQSLDSWRQSLVRAIDLAPDHVACYGLTYEPATRLTAQLHHGHVTPCDEDLEADMFHATVDVLGAAGYRQYEISNFARTGCECRHNLLYWRNQPYIGVGPSAAGCVNDRRYKNVPDIAAYVRRMDERGRAEAESEALTAEMIALEMVMMQMRLCEGLSVTDFRQRMGVDPRHKYAAALGRLTAKGWVTATCHRIALTRAGMLVANRVIAEMVTGERTVERSLKVL